MGGEATVICLDTSFSSPCWFLDQKRAVESYCQRKLDVHPDNLVGLVTSSHLAYGCLVAPTSDIKTVTYSLNALYRTEADKQVPQCIDTSLLRGFTLFHVGVLPQDNMKKRIVLFSGGGSPFYTTGHSPQALASFLKAGRVALDVIDFGTRVRDKEDFKAKYLKALVVAMNDHNETYEDSRYFLIEDDGVSLCHHINIDYILACPEIISSTEGEVTMIFVDTTSTTSLSCFLDQIEAVLIYCERKLRAHPRNLVSIAGIVQQDLVTHLDPTNSLQNIAYTLRALKPHKQEYTDLLKGFKLFLYGLFDHEYMIRRIVVFSGSPFPTTHPSPEAMASVLRIHDTVLDVFDFSSRVKDKEDCEAEYLKGLVDALNDNDVKKDSRYFPIEDDGLSLCHKILRSPILPPPYSDNFQLFDSNNSSKVLIFNDWSDIYYEYCWSRRYD